MNDLVAFQFGSYEVRTVLIDGEPWWVLKDVCDVLGIGNSRDVKDRLEDDERGVGLIDTLGGKQEMIIVNESGLYSVILRSDKQEAKEFKRWITHDVLPSIRKTGGYYLPKTLPEALRELANQVEAREAAEAQLSIMKHKADFFDQVANSKDAIPMRNIAAVLNMPGLGRNKLFQILRDKKIFDNENIPYREYQDRGYFRVIERIWVDTKGERHIAYSTLVYQKGLDFIRKLVSEQKSPVVYKYQYLKRATV